MTIAARLQLIAASEAVAIALSIYAQCNIEVQALETFTTNEFRACARRSFKAWGSPSNVCGMSITVVETQAKQSNSKERRSHRCV